LATAGLLPNRGDGVLENAGSGQLNRLSTDMLSSQQRTQVVPGMNDRSAAAAADSVLVLRRKLRLSLPQSKFPSCRRCNGGGVLACSSALPTTIGQKETQPSLVAPDTGIKAGCDVQTVGASRFLHAQCALGFFNPAAVACRLA
jgi:hypothetical protein